MSEIRRVALNTIEPQKESDKVNKKTCKTVRISVILPESNEDKCPEYNYKDQLAAVKRKNKVNKESNHDQENGLDPFGEDDDDVRRIALEMEAKYGASVTAGKKKRKGRKDDYADIGMGYDESDSFIDNTDGYDEIVPQDLTTLHGGFYINCGVLEFKTDDEASSQIYSSSSSESEDEEDDDVKTKSISRKRILDTSEGSDSDTAKNNTQAEKKPKMQSDKNAMQLAIKKKLFSQNKIQIKKNRLLDPQKKTVKELLREKREDLNMSVPPELEKEEHLDKDSLKENKKPMSITSVTDAIESVVKQVVEETYDNNQNTQVVDITNSTDNPVNKYNSEPPLLTMEGESSQDQPEKRELPKLPENIPTDILEIVGKIKQAALEYRDEGKKKFFSDDVNAYLLSLEKKCKILGKSSRLRIYDFLSYFCKVRKETLIRRAKNLILEEEERRLKTTMRKLRDCVEGIMPVLIAKFENESQSVLEKKFSNEGQNDDNKNLKLPRRRFQWTDETKKLLKDIMLAKKKCLILEGKQKDNLEDLLVQFMRTTVLPIWPEGWMYINNLKKVFNSMTDSSKSISNSSRTVIDSSNIELSTDKSNIDKSNLEKSIIDKSNVDKSTIDKSIVDRSTIDKSNVDKSSIDKSNMDRSISDKSISDGSLNAIAPKHSNLTITPVEVKSSTAKPEVSNSVTVTKITNDVASNSTNTISESTTMSGPHLLKKMFDDIVKPNKTDDNKSSSTYPTLHEKGKPERDYSRKKAIGLDVPTSSSRHPQEAYKQQAEKNLTVEQKNHWPNEIYGSHKEQSIPADYSSKHSSSRHSEEKIDAYKHSSNTAKNLWSNKDPEPIKYSRQNEVSTSSKHSSSKHSSKASSSNDNPKPISLSVNDILMKPDKQPKVHSESSSSTKHHSSDSTAKHSSESSNKYHSESSRHHTESSKQYSDSNKHYSDGSSKHHSESSTKHHSDSGTTKRYSDNTKNYSDSTKHYTDGTKYHSDSTRYHSDSNTKHYSESSKHSKKNENLKLPVDNHVIVLNAHQSKDGDSKIGAKDDLKSIANAVIPKSSHCQLMDLSDGRSKSSKIDDNKSHSSKYSSSKDLITRSEMAKTSSKSTVSTAAADLLLTNSTNYFNDHQMKVTHKYTDFGTGSSFLSSTPNKLPKNVEGDSDLQMVMENLKTLQKMSCSPVKNDSTSSPVSVIAFNKNFSSNKSSSSSQGSGIQRSNSGNDAAGNKSDFSGTFQDDFQKQFINSIQMSANPNSNTKSNYRCS